MTKISYISHPNPTCRGNPLIEGLGYPMTEFEVPTACDSGFEKFNLLEGVPEQYHGYYIRSTIDNLSETYIARDEAYALYEKLRRMIEAGYKKRNPANPVFKNKMLTAVHQDKDEQVNAYNLKRVTGQDIDSLLTANGSFLLAGLSGAGKTSMMLRVLKLIPQHLYHTDYFNPEGIKIKIEEDQIPYIYVQVHNRKGQKAFLKGIVEAVEVATNYPYLSRDVKNGDSIDDLIRLVRKLMLKHNVGVLVIDEAQNIAQNKDNLILGSNEKTSMKFVEEIFNRIGVPLFFIGTLATLNLFGKEVTVSRRTLIDGGLLLLGADVEGDFWSRFFTQINQTHLLKGKHDNGEILKRHLHMLTGGIPAIALSLMRATLSHMSKFDNQQQGVTIKSLSHVFKEQFSILQQPMRALRDKKFHKYEDLAPIADLITINGQIQQELKGSTSTSSEKVAKNSSTCLPKTDEEADKKVNEDLNKVRQVKKKNKCSKAPVLDAKLAKQIGVSNLLKISSKSVISTSEGNS
ncbi:transposase [Shewanella sp. OPT22]|nr:transposase [Shewanella sp. OPT22]